MKVLCIDNKVREDTADNEALKKLIEGVEYNAHQSAFHEDGYCLEEIYTSNPNGFYKDRFIPLSDKDETEYADKIMDSIFQPVEKQ